MTTAAPCHSREFAKALAMTALDLVAQPGELKKAKEEFTKTEG